MSDINHKDEMDDTPLHWAVILNEPRIVKFLLQNGASRELVNTYYRNNPIMTACTVSVKAFLHISDAIILLNCFAALVYEVIFHLFREYCYNQ